MTVAEFDQTIQNMGELISFCYDNNMTEFVDNVYSVEQMDDYLDENLVQFAHEMGWRELYRYLDRVPDDVEFVRLDDEFNEIDWQDEEEYIRNVREAAIEAGVLEVEVQEENTEEESQEDLEEDVEEVEPEMEIEDLSILPGLFAACSAFASTAVTPTPQQEDMFLLPF